MLVKQSNGLRECDLMAMSTHDRGGSGLFASRMKQGFKGQQPLDGVWGRASGGCKSGLPHFPPFPGVGRGRKELSKSLGCGWKR